MVRIDKEYVFEGADGKTSLLDLFEGRRQLIVISCLTQHRLYRLQVLWPWTSNHERPRLFRSYFSSAARKLERYKARQGWNLRWISSFGSDFNHDFRHADTSSSSTTAEEPGRGKTRSGCILPQPSHLSHLLDLREAVKVDRRLQPPRFDPLRSAGGL